MEAQAYQQRRESLLAVVADDSVVVMFAGKAGRRSADENHTFTPNRNFLYLTGLDDENLILVLTKRGDKTTETLYVERPDELVAKWNGARITDEAAQEISGAAAIGFVDTFQKSLTQLLLPGTYQHFYFDLEQRDWQAPLDASHEFSKQMRDVYPAMTIRNAYPLLCHLRTIKSVAEVASLKIAIDTTRTGIERMMANAKPGINEAELEAHFDFALHAAGVKEHAFHSIIAGGKNATVLHYSDNNKPIRDGDLVLLDLGATHDYYSADISRTFPVNGKFTDRQKAFYNLVLKAQTETMSVVKAGAPFTLMNETTKRVLAAGLKELGLITEDDEVSRYYFHGVSHYLGLDTHDVGNRDTLLTGMVVTMEPGLYIPEEGIGIRIEDDLLVTADGYENLSSSILKTVEEIEAFMAGK